MKKKYLSEKSERKITYAEKSYLKINQALHKKKSKYTFFQNNYNFLFILRNRNITHMKSL